MQTQKITLLFLFTVFGIFSINAQLPNDICADAIPINMGTNCLEGTNEGAINDTIFTCAENTVLDVWYSYNAAASGLVSLKTDVGFNDSLFNDVLSIYSGNCNDLTTIKCSNYDEYGFQGEKEFFDVIAGETYFIQISGQARNFGKEMGKFCLELASETALPNSPNNDFCNEAITLVVNEDWQSFNNHHAKTDNIFADELERSRADIWYQITPENGTLVKVLLQADFSHTLALYEGTCADLNLISKNVNGFELITENLNANETYFLQISGRFATLEGNFQIKIEDEPIINENHFCEDATLIQPDGNCIPFENAGVSFSDIRPSCFLYATADFWYQYSPLQSGSFKINTHADYQHGIAVYTNSCDSLVEIYCSEYFFPCEGYIEPISAEVGEDYFIQILTNNTFNASVVGSGCLEIISDLQSDNSIPLSLEVTPFCLTDSTAELKIKAKGGFGNYTFHGNQAGEILPIGSPYFVQVVDENGCQEIITGTVDCSELPDDCEFFYHLEIEDITCNSATNGAATLSVAEGLNPTFLWSNGETTATANNLSIGEHFVEVTSSSGDICTFYFDIFEPNPLSATTTIHPQNSGTNTDELITVFPMGGTPPYHYLWSNDAVTQAIPGLDSGYYVATVTDGNNCTDTVGVLYEAFLVEIDADLSPVCEGETVPLTAISNRSGTFEWNDGSNVAEIIANATGNYSVTVTDDLGNTAEANVFIEILPQPNIIITSDGPTHLCEGDEVILTASGGVNYSWDDNNNTTGNTLTATESGDYSVMVTDMNGCTNSETVSAIVFDLPEVSIESPTGLDFCEGESITLEAASDANVDFYWNTIDTAVMLVTLTETTDVTLVAVDENGCIDSAMVTVTERPLPTAIITPGTFLEFCENLADSVDLTASGGLQYNWNTGEATQNIQVFGAMDYTVTVTDFFGCTDTETTTIVIHDSPTASITALSEVVFCEGESVELQAEGGEIYNWNNGENTQNVIVFDSNIYNVTVTDVNGCTNIASQIVQTNSLPDLTLTPDMNICEGDTANLAATTNPDNIFLWSTLETTPSIEVVESGVYSVMVTDLNDCSITDSLYVTVLPIPQTPQITPSNNQVLCEGESVTLTSDFPATTIWLPNGISEPSIEVSIAGNYSAFQTDANGCNSEISDSITVEVLPLPAPPVITVEPDLAVCAPETITLTSNYISGNTWSNNVVDQSIVFSTGIETFTITHTDADGCTSLPSDSVTVRVNLPPNGFITVIGDTTICEDETVELVANGGVQYAWNVPGQISQSIITSSAGAYIVTITDANGCEDVVSQDVTVNPLPTPNITMVGDTLFSDPAVSYQWYFDGILLPDEMNQWIVPEQTGQYAVEIIDNNGCVGISSPITEVIELSNIGSIEVFPIPVQNELFVNLKLEKQVEEVHLNLYNLIGQSVYFQSIEPKSTIINHEIDLTNLPAGNYYLQIETEGQQAVQKIIKQ